jgi:pyruvate/2-oxoglutarate dehydrogenase complex dihydrolipoamide dehydrogenase (E3) component
VTVLERDEAPGGQMRLALAAPGHREVAEGLIDVLSGWLAGADVRYGVDAGVEDVLELRPDRVILAAGAEPYRPALAGDGVAVVHAWEALAGVEAGSSVVVSDWGGDWTGLDVAELLAAEGRRVRLVTAAVAFGQGVHQYQRNLYLARLDDAGVELLHHLRPVALRPAAVEFANVFSHRPVVLEGVDTLVVSAGRTARNDLHDALLAANVPVERVGDCLGPRSFEEAIREGTLAGMGIAEPVRAA